MFLLLVIFIILFNYIESYCYKIVCCFVYKSFIIFYWIIVDDIGEYFLYNSYFFYCKLWMISVVVVIGGDFVVVVNCPLVVVVVDDERCFRRELNISAYFNISTNNYSLNISLNPSIILTSICYFNFIILIYILSKTGSYTCIILLKWLIYIVKKDDKNYG